MRDIKDKKSTNIIIILSALLIIFITINTIPFKSNTSWNQTREDSTKSKTETPHLSFENVWMVNGTAICTAINDQAYTQITSDGAGGQSSHGKIVEAETTIFTRNGLIS